MSARCSFRRCELVTHLYLLDQVLLALCSRVNFNVSHREPSPAKLHVDVFGESSSEEEEEIVTPVVHTTDSHQSIPSAANEESTWGSDEETYDSELEAARNAALAAKRAPKGSLRKNRKKTKQVPKVMSKQTAAVTIQKHARRKLVALHEQQRRFLNSVVVIQSAARLFLNQSRVRKRILEREQEIKKRKAAEFALWQATMKADKQRAEQEAKRKKVVAARTSALSFLRAPRVRQGGSSTAGIGERSLATLRATALLHKRGRYYKNKCEAERFILQIGAHFLDLRRNWKQHFLQMQSDARERLGRFGAAAKKRLIAQHYLQSMGNECRQTLQDEYENAGRYERAARLRGKAQDSLVKLGRVFLRWTGAQSVLRPIGSQFREHVWRQSQARSLLTKSGRQNANHLEAQKYLQKAGNEILFVTLPKILDDEKEEREARLRREEEERRRKQQEAEEQERLLAILKKQHQRTKRNWNLARGKIGSSMRVWGALQKSQTKAEEAKNRAATNISKLQKTQLALTVLQAAKMYRKQTKTTDSDVKEKYPLRVVAADPKQVKVKKGAFLEDISLKSLIHSSEETYLPRWRPSNASDDEDDDDDVINKEATVQEDKTNDPLNFQFRTPIIEAESTLVDRDSSELALEKWNSFFDEQDSSKIVGKEALMTDEAREAEVEKEALQNDYMHLLEAKRARDRRQRLKKQMLANAARRAELARLKQQGAANLDLTELEEFQQAMQDGAGQVAFHLREERASRINLLRAGTLKTEALPIDKVLIRQILTSSESGRTYFYARVPAGSPLLLEVSVKRGAVDVFVAARVPPARQDNSWQMLDIAVDRPGRLLVDVTDSAYEPGTYYICVERSNSAASKGCRFGIRASLLQGEDPPDSAAMQNAERQLEKLRVIHSQLDQLSRKDDDDVDDDLDDVMEQLRADLLAQGMARAKTSKELAAEELERRAFALNGRVFYVGETVMVPRPKPTFEPEAPYSFEQYRAAIQLQALARGLLHRKHAQMTRQELAANKKSLAERPPVLSAASITGKVIGNPAKGGLVPIMFEEDKYSTHELATVIAASVIAEHNQGSPEPMYLPDEPEEVENEEEVHSEVSSVASLPDELKERYLEFDFIDDEQ